MPRPKRYRFQISIHAPRVGCDATASALQYAWLVISIHAPRVGCDDVSELHGDARLIFQSTHPGWGATWRIKVRFLLRMISIHAPRVGCDIESTGATIAWWISIHAPRVGCDILQSRKNRSNHHFNPRTPGGVRHTSRHTFVAYQLFQSTHPGWGATNRLVLENA